MVSPSNQPESLGGLNLDHIDQRIRRLPRSQQAAFVRFEDHQLMIYLHRLFRHSGAEKQFDVGYRLGRRFGQRCFQPADLGPVVNLASLRFRSQNEGPPFARDGSPSVQIGLPLWVLNGLGGPEIRLPLFPRKRTQSGHRAMSVWCR